MNMLLDFLFELCVGFVLALFGLLFAGRWMGEQNVWVRVAGLVLFSLVWMAWSMFAAFKTAEVRL